MTKSCRDKHGRWTNPWPTWRFPSYATLLRFLLLDKNHSNVPTSKEVSEVSDIPSHLLGDLLRLIGCVPHLLHAAGSGCRAAGDGAVLRSEPGPLRVGPGSPGHLVGSCHRAGGNRRAEHSDRPHFQPEGLAGAVHGAQKVSRAALLCGTGRGTFF